MGFYLVWICMTLFCGYIASLGSVGIITGGFLMFLLLAATKV